MVSYAPKGRDSTQVASASNGGGSFGAVVCGAVSPFLLSETEPAAPAAPAAAVAAPLPPGAFFARRPRECGR